MSPKVRPLGAWADYMQVITEPAVMHRTANKTSPNQLPGPDWWIRFERVPVGNKRMTVDVAVGPDKDGRLALWGIATEAPITADLLRSLPLDALRKASGEALISSQVNFFPDISTLTMADKHSPEFLRGVLEVIEQAKAARKPIARAVADAADVEEAQAKRYIKRARDWAKKQDKKP